MKRFKNILFFSNPEVKQGAAIARAVALAKQNEARLAVISVIKEPKRKIRDPLAGSALKELQRKIVHERHNQLINDFRKQGVDVEAKVVSGVAFIEVIREALREQHDLVILAADGKHSFIKRLFGSTSMHLMRKCPCPVWVVKPVAGKSYNRILAAVDTTDDPFDDTQHLINPLILQLASSLARMDNSELHVVQAWAIEYEDYMQVRGDMTDQAIRRLRKTSKQEYVRNVERLMKDLDLSGIKSIHTHIKRSDDPANVISKLVSKEKIDLLVMGTVCRSGLSGFFIGNTAEEVLASVNCSVLTVKRAGFVSPVTLEEH